MNNRIHDAYEKIKYDDEAEKRMLDKILFEASENEMKPNIKRGKQKAIKALAIAVAAVLLLCAGAVAVGLAVNNEAQALEVALREIEVLKEKGLLSEKIELRAETCSIVYSENGENGTSRFKMFDPIYNLTYNGALEDGAYGYIAVNVYTGKITDFTICASPQGTGKKSEEMFADYYETGTQYTDNFDDVFDTNMTIGQYCETLKEYWGYKGFEIGAENEGVSENSLMTDCAGKIVEVYFDGDRRGEPQYIEVQKMIVGVFVGFGFAHSLG